MHGLFFLSSDVFLTLLTFVQLSSVGHSGQVLHFISFKLFHTSKWQVNKHNVQFLEALYSTYSKLFIILWHFLLKTISKCGSISSLLWHRSVNCLSVRYDLTWGSWVWVIVGYVQKVTVFYNIRGITQSCGLEMKISSSQYYFIYFIACMFLNDLHSNLRLFKNKIWTLWKY